MLSDLSRGILLRQFDPIKVAAKGGSSRVPYLCRQTLSNLGPRYLYDNLYDQNVSNRYFSSTTICPFLDSLVSCIVYSMVSFPKLHAFDTPCVENISRVSC